MKENINRAIKFVMRRVVPLKTVWRRPFMKDNFEKSFKLMIAHEGGFVNDPHDPGGPTNLGVTQRAWEEWVGRKVTVQEIRDLKVENIKEFYRSRYWDAIRGDDLLAGLDYTVFDFAVHAGVNRAAKTLQMCAEVEPDGKIGKITLAAVNEIGAVPLIKAVNHERLTFLQELKTFSRYGRAWTRRVRDVEKASLELAT